MVTIAFSAFQTVRRKEGCNSVKNTVAKRGDNRVFGVSGSLQENRVVTLLNDWEMKEFGIPDVSVSSK